jgi:hypothetical protein
MTDKPERCAACVRLGEAGGARSVMKALQLALAIVFSAAIAAATASAQTPADTSARNLSLEQQTKIADAITRAAGAPVRESEGGSEKIMLRR